MTERLLGVLRMAIEQLAVELARELVTHESFRQQLLAMATHQNEQGGNARSSGLAELRKARQLSRLDLATRAGLTESTIIRAERSTPPAVQARTIEKIAHALGVPVGELLAPPRPVTPVTAADPDVLFIQDLARELRTTVRRLRTLLEHEPWKLPAPLPTLEKKRLRWSRVTVDKWLAFQHEVDAVVTREPGKRRRRK